MKDDLPDEPLTAAATKALDAARALAERPTDEQRLRMKAAVLAKVGGTAATVAAVKATAVKATVVKAVIGLALVGGALATILVVSQPSERAPSRRDLPPVVSASPAPLASAPASAEPELPDAPPPSASASTIAPPAAAPAAHDGNDDEAFRREVDAVRQAQLHLREDEPTQALAALRPWSTSTTDPLRDERWAIQIEALCQIGKTSEGLRQREAFLRALPSSPLAARVRGLCASADADPGF